MEEIIRVSHLKKYFRETKAVDDISFTVKKGEQFGFLGVNGAGKSTTINMLCTLSSPTEGEAEIAGLRLGKDNEEIKRHIGVVYQNNCLDPLLTVKENLMLRGGLYETDPRKLRKNYEHVCEILELSDVSRRPYRMLSGGQKRRCEIARALMHTGYPVFGRTDDGIRSGHAEKRMENNFKSAKRITNDGIPDNALYGGGRKGGSHRHHRPRTPDPVRYAIFLEGAVCEGQAAPDSKARAEGGAGSGASEAGNLIPV